MAQEDRRKRFRGLVEDDVRALDFTEFIALVPSRERRTLKHGLSHEQKKVLDAVKAGKSPKTHARDMVIMPDMLGATIKVYDGKQYVDVRVELEMLGHRLGEFAPTRRLVKHQAPGIGATKSSSHMSVK
jgi:small subunit ribosomal protein S19